LVLDFGERVGWCPAVATVAIAELASQQEGSEDLWSPLSDRIWFRRHPPVPCISFTGWNWLHASFIAMEFGLLVISSTTASAAARKSTRAPIQELWILKLTINPVYMYYQ
jgi:hypothetical protein